jgi:hypothetical protein
VLRSRCAWPVLAVFPTFETRSLARCADVQGWGSLPDQQRRAANEQTCFFGNKRKDVRMGQLDGGGRRGLDCFALLRGKGGGQAFTCFGVKSEVSEIYFWGWEKGWGCVVWKEKVRQADDLYLCQYSPVSSCRCCRQEAGRGSTKVTATPSSVM